MTILVPNEVAWLAENIGNFSRIKLLDTPHGSYSELVIATALPLKESSPYGADTDAIGMDSGGRTANRDLGAWQCSTRWHSQKFRIYNWRDPYENVKVAKAIYVETLKAFPTRLGQASGFTAWSVFNAVDDADLDKDPEWGAGVWHEMIAPALLGVDQPFQPFNPHTTPWKV